MILKLEKNLFYYLPIILFTLIPFFLITGPFLSDLSISLISLLFLIQCITKNNFSYFKNKFFYLFLLLWFYLVLNSIINYNNIETFLTSVVYCRYGIFIIAIVHLLNLNNKIISYFFYSIFMCFSILILDGYYQYFTGYNILGWENGGRSSSFFGDEKILGSYISRLWPIFFGLSLLIFKQKNKFLYLLIIIFILSETLIFLSGDRSAFFYINLSAIFIILLSQGVVRLRLFTLISSIILISLISYINPSAKYRFVDRTLEQMNLSVETTNIEDQEVFIFSKQHTHHYLSAYKMFLDNKLLGVGIKNFRHFCSDEKYKISELSCSTHPHNTYIQVLSETGLIGFSFLLIALFYFFKYSLKHLLLKFRSKYYFNDFEICILSGIAIYLWPIIPTGSIFTNWLNIIMILNLPFLIWSRGLNNE